MGLVPWQVEIVHAFLEGRSVADISLELRRSRFTVRQVLNRTLHRLHARMENDE